MRPQYKSDYNTLLEAMLPFLEKTIKEFPAIIPVGATLDLNRQCNLAAADSGEEESDGSLEEVLLIQGMRKQAAEGTLLACAIGYSCNIVVERQSDKPMPVLAVRLEHKEGPPEIFYRPYKKGWTGTRLMDPFLIAGKTVVFADAGGGNEAADAGDEESE